MFWSGSARYRPWPLLQSWWPLDRSWILVRSHFCVGRQRWVAPQPPASSYVWNLSGTTSCLWFYPDWHELITWCDSASPWRQHKGDEVNVAPMPTSLTRSACTIKTACQHRTPRLHWGERKHYTSNNINRKWSRCFQGSSENDVSWSFDETVRPSLLIIIIRIILF